MFEGNFTVGNMISGIFNFPDKSILNCKFINWKINSSTIFIDKNEENEKIVKE